MSTDLEPASDSPAELDPAFAYAARLAVIDGQAAEDSLAPLTRDAYRRGWAVFESWCIRNQLVSMPATVETVRAFVAALRDGSARKPEPETKPKTKASVSSINQHLAAIWAKHADEGEAASKDDPMLQKRMRGYAKQDRDRLVRQMSALLLHDIQRIMSSMDASLQQIRQAEQDPRAMKKAELLDLRDRAVLLVGLSTALRREELAAIRVEHCRAEDNGIIITPPHTKSDQTGTRRRPRPVPRGNNIATCPVTALQRWQEAAGITEGPIFRPVTRWGTVGAKAFTGQVVWTIVRGRAAAAGLPGTWGAHSLRAGFATQSARNGVPRHVIMAGGDWNSSAVDGYIRLGAIWDESASTKLGL